MLYVFDEITEKIKDLTPKQRKTAFDILSAYVQNLFTNPKYKIVEIKDVQG